MYLLDPRSPAHFHPKVVELLKKGDENSIRYRQLHDCACNKIRLFLFYHTLAVTDRSSLL